MIVAISQLFEQMWALGQMNLPGPSKYQGSHGPPRFLAAGVSGQNPGSGWGLSLLGSECLETETPLKNILILNTNFNI